MSWDAIVGGELHFESEQAVAAWNKAPLGSPAATELPSWLTPPRSATGKVAQERAHQKTWSTSFEKYMHVPDRMEVEEEGTTVALRAYLSGHYGSHFLGSLAAIVRAAASAGAQGEVAFIELSQMRGHILVAGKGTLKVEPVDLAQDASRAKALSGLVKWVGKRARMKLPPLGKRSERSLGTLRAAVDQDRGMTFAAPPHPLRAVHEAAGASYGPAWEESFETPTHRLGIERERALLERDCGIVDLSHAARISLNNKAAYECLQSFAPSLPDLPREHGASADLRDGTGVFDHVLVFRTGIGTPEVYGCNGGEQLLDAWLKSKVKEGKWIGARKVDVGDGYTAYSPRIAFVGPNATAFAKAALASHPPRVLLRFPATFRGLPAVVVHGEPDVLGKMLAPHLERLCGSAAERAVAAAQGVTLPPPINLQRPEFAG